MVQYNFKAIQVRLLGLESISHLPFAFPPSAPCSHSHWSFSSCSRCQRQPTWWTSFSQSPSFPAVSLSPRADLSLDTYSLQHVALCTQFSTGPNARYVSLQTKLFSSHSGLLRLLCSHWPRLFLSLPYLTQALVLCSCQSQTPTVVHNGWAIQRIRQFYTRTSFASGSKSEQHFWYHLIFSLLCCTTLYRQGEIHIIEHCGSSRSHPNQFSEGM